MNNILFIPTYSYLSEPIFKRILFYLEGYKTFYLDVEEQFQSKSTSESFKNLFDYIVKINIDIRINNKFIGILKIFDLYKFQLNLIYNINKINPNIIISTSDLSFSIRIIKKFFPDIPIVIIQSALFTNNTFKLTYFQKIKYLILNKLFNINIIPKQNHFANEYDDIYLLLWGEYFTRYILSTHKKDRIKIIGDITLDSFPIKKDFLKKNDFLKSRKFSTDCKIIIICTGAYGELFSNELLNNLYDIYIKTIYHYQNVFFIIKPHPREEKNTLIDYVKNNNIKNVYIAQESLYELFRYTDIHISSFSRTALEALASNIPILSVNPNNEIKLEDFFNNDLNEKVINTNEMILKIDALLESTEEFLFLREQYIEKMLYKLDGKATERAVEIINQLVKNGSYND